MALLRTVSLVAACEAPPPPDVRLTEPDTLQKMLFLSVVTESREYINYRITLLDLLKAVNSCFRSDLRNASTSSLYSIPGSTYDWYILWIQTIRSVEAGLHKSISCSPSEGILSTTFTPSSSLSVLVSPRLVVLSDSCRTLSIPFLSYVDCCYWWAVLIVWGKKLPL